MTICQICGNEGFFHLLTHCMQCESVAAHRYCVLNPSILEETIKWLCEFCDPGKIKPTAPSRKSQDLNSKVQQTVLGHTVQTKLGLPEFEKPNSGQKEIPKETTDILDQNNEDNSSKRKQVKRSDDVKKGERKYDSVIQKESCQAVQVKEQSVTNVCQADANGHPQANLSKIKSTIPNRKSQDINTKIQQTVVRKTAQTKLGNNLCLPESEKPNNGKKEIPKETSDTFILDQNEDNGSRRTQVKRSDDVKKGEINYDSGVQTESCQAVQVKEQSVANVSQAETNGHPPANPESVVYALSAKVEDDILDQNEDNSSKIKQVKRSNDVKKREIIYESGVQKKSCQAVQVKEQRVTNVSQADTNDHPPANPESVVCALLAKVEDDIIGGTRLVKRQKIRRSLLLNKGDEASSLGKSSCKVYSKQMELHKDDSQPDAELAYPADEKKSEVEETIADFVKRTQVKQLVGVKKKKQGNYDNGVKKGSFEADQVNKQSVKNVSRSDTNGHQQVNLGKKVKKIKQSNYDDGVKKGSFEADQVKKQTVKNVSLSDSDGRRQVNLGKSVGPLSTKVNDNVVTESTCKAGHCIQGGTKLLEQKKPKSGLAPKKGDGASGLDKSSCQVSSKQTKEVHMNDSQPGAEEADYANKKKSELEEITAEFVVNREPLRKRRKFIIEMEYSDEEPVFVVTKHSQLVAHVGQDHLRKSPSEALSKLNDDGLAQLSSIESGPPRSSPMKADEPGHTLESSVVFDNRIPAETLYSADYVPTQPLNEVAWRGYCRSIDNENPVSLVLEAHLSNKAHENVRGAVRDLPMSLEFNLVSKKNAWPKSFERSPPTADGIGLYFFPIDERSEILYDCLVDTMSEHSLVLKVLLEYVELLIFCSGELPREERTLQRKYYLWGVFKPRKDLAIPDNPSTNVHIRENGPIYQQKDPSTLTYPAYRSTRSFSETHDMHGLSNTPVCQEAEVESLELPRPYFDRLYQSHDKQGPGIHNGDTRISQKLQDHEHRNRTENRKGKYSDRNHKYPKNDGGWNPESRKRKNRDWRSLRNRSKRSYDRIEVRSNYR